MKHLILVALAYVIFTVCWFFGLVAEAPYGPATLRNFAVALLLPAIAGAMALGFLGIWSLVFDVGPARFRRHWQGPPWETPRPLNPFNSRESADHAAMLTRLDTIRQKQATRQTLYRDRDTGQHWLGQYAEQGFGSGELLTPISKARAEAFQMPDTRP